MCPRRACGLDRLYAYHIAANAGLLAFAILLVISKLTFVQATVCVALRSLAALPAEFPLAQFMAGNDQDDAGTGATGGTGGATGATGSGATGEEVDPFATVEERVENVGSQ